MQGMEVADMQCIKDLEDCSLLVNSCDAYCDTWKPFFLILNNRWKNLNIPIYLNTENKKFEMENLDIRTINFTKKAEWGGD